MLASSLARGAPHGVIPSIQPMSGAVSHVILRRAAVERDWKLSLAHPRNNGRKVLVTALWPFAESRMEHPEWAPGSPGGRTPVLETGPGGIEIATFTEDADQDRHKHLISTEIYTVLKGRMRIRIDDGDLLTLDIGDEIVVLPGTVHEIVGNAAEENSEAGKPRLLIRVHAFQCHGENDKYVQLEPGGPWFVWKDLSPERRRLTYRTGE
jgi:mannose-6-phosphate isomerase-like protein (cupin superfamily)